MTQTAYGEDDLPVFPGAYGNEAADESAAEPGIEALADLDSSLPDLDEDDSAEAEGASSGVRTAAPAKPNRAYIRKVAAKALEVETSTDAVKSLAAALLGSGEDTVELTVAIMTAGRSSVQPLTDIAEVLEALADEPWEAGIIAAAMDAGRQKAVWAVVQARGAAGSTALPKALAKAAKLIVKAINSLDADDKTALTAAGELLKRS